MVFVQERANVTKLCYSSPPPIQEAKYLKADDYLLGTLQKLTDSWGRLMIYQKAFLTKTWFKSQIVSIPADWRLIYISFIPNPSIVFYMKVGGVMATFTEWPEFNGTDKHKNIC